MLKKGKGKVAKTHDGCAIGVSQHPKPQSNGERVCYKLGR